MEKTIKTINIRPTWAWATSTCIQLIAQDGLKANYAIEELMRIAKHLDANQQAEDDFKAMDAQNQACSLILDAYDKIGDAYRICAGVEGIAPELLQAVMDVEDALSNLNNKFQAIR